MQNRDILWAISLPFRMFNTQELDLNSFIFTLSFDTALQNINVMIARKLVTVALEKGWIDKKEEDNSLHANFELWEPKFFPPSWQPTFKDLLNVTPIKLTPLDTTVEYKPKIIKKVKKSEPIEVSPLLNLSTIKEERKETTKKQKIELEKREVPDEKESKETKKIEIAKKKKTSKKEKGKGQKSIHDFFR